MSHPGPLSSETNNVRSLFHLPANPSPQDIAQLQAYVNQASRSANVATPASHTGAPPPASQSEVFHSFGPQPPFTQAAPSPTSSSSSGNLHTVAHVANSGGQLAITPYRSARLSHRDPIPSSPAASEPHPPTQPSQAQHAPQYPTLPVEIPGANNGIRALGYPPFQRPSSFLWFSEHDQPSKSTAIGFGLDTPSTSTGTSCTDSDADTGSARVGKTWRSYSTTLTSI
ncbi:hypothetical protein NLJ89_g8471 [Agrocybe chaxingu]|uniref:Uncharacterized protein n=1 Tax=Agrocybe chaxingu TaxID=84603 RepID=A0A9W8JVD7_9AGAR|nr:hypothetical protein NLJ89_g8471 [Agrocybe chaxingu]